MGTAARVIVESRAAAQTTTEKVKRRKRSVAEKRRLVEESFQPGNSVARVARANGVNANQIFAWRKLYQRGLLGGNASTAALLPVKVADPQPNAAASQESQLDTPTPATFSVAPGTIQLQLPKGRLRIEGNVDAESLRVIMECLLG
jgi:transposase